MLQEASHQRGDRPDRAHPVGRAHLPHRQSCQRLPQAAHGLRGGQGRSQEGLARLDAEGCLWKK